MAETKGRLGPYELVRRLGVGGMAETFLAVRRGPGGFEQRVCVKRTLPAFESDRDFVRLFIDEARVSALLRHTNIVQVLDFGEADGAHYLALELVEGLDLREVIRALTTAGQTLSPPLVAFVAHELGAALAFAHKSRHGEAGASVVHRDISPSNVLLSFEGEVKLTDFGIAKAVRSGHVTQSGVIKGKVPYMAPEYALRAHFDARSDLFALGVTLFEATCGKRPFDGLTDLDTLQRICAGTHTPLSELAPDAPRGLVDAIEKLICADAEARFASATELLDALVVVAPPPTARRQLGELVERLAATMPTPTPSIAPRATQELERGSSDGAPAHAADTTVATAGGTEVLESALGGAVSPSPIVPAGPDERTRTRAVQGLVVEDGHTRTELDVSSIPKVFAPRVDEHTAVPLPGEHPAEIAAAETKRLGEPSTLDSPVGNPGVRAERSRRVTWVGAVGVIAVALVLVFVLVASRTRLSQEQTPLIPEAATPTRATTSASTFPSTPTSTSLSTPTSTSRSPSTSTSTSPSTATSTSRSPSPSTSTSTSPSTFTSPSTLVGNREVVGSRERGSSAPNDPAAGSRAPDAPSTPTSPSTPTATPGSATPASRGGSVQVIVVPFGRVWLDGRAVGHSPLTLTVTPGRHVVATGDVSPSRARTIRVLAGGHVQVTIK